MKRTISLLLSALLFVAALPTAHAANRPRISRCETPENIPETPGGLPAAIPSAYRKGSLLSMDKDWMAYADVTDTSTFTVQSRSKDTQAYTDWGYDDLSAIIVDGNTVICLEGGLYTDDSILEIIEDEMSVYDHAFSQPDGYDALKYLGGIGSGMGTLLALDDGTLLIMDTYGALYACGRDGSGLRQIIDTIIADFVYYDGMIYFMNLDDTAEYKGVICDTCGDADDLNYPTLYRVRLDGSGIEKLTDCGVWGLSSQGNMILYQNIDEAFAFDIPEVCGYRFLSGPLYRYDAETGEHRPLHIESNQYIPTPYGLAVWYNEFCIEPYDVERADLVLHDYDGKPLHKLDAGVIELFGQCTVADANLAFHSYNLYPMILWNQGLSDSWDAEPESEDVFTTVPLDGSPKIGGVHAAPRGAEYAGDEEGDWWGTDDDDWGYGDVEHECDASDEWWFDDDEWSEDEDWLYVYPGMFEDGWSATEAVLNQKMATRTGPGTKYAEDHGTLSESTEIVVYAQEETGGTPWVLVEFVKDGKLVRAYTGLKRVDTDIAEVPKTTRKPKAAVVAREATAYYGPDTAYLAAMHPVQAGTEVWVYGVDKAYALIEYALNPDVWTRSWVPVSSIAFREE